MMTQSGAVVVADSDGETRALATRFLQRAGYATVEVETGADALDAARRDDVSVLLVEVELPDLTGYEVCRELRAENGNGLPIFLLSATRTDAVDRVGGLLLGADDFIVKPFDPNELVARVRRFASRYTSAKQNEDDAGEHSTQPRLTAREREVLELLAEGRRQKQIAAQLSISPKTVDTHIQNLLRKFGVHSRVELVARAYALRVVTAA